MGNKAPKGDAAAVALDGGGGGAARTAKVAPAKEGATLGGGGGTTGNTASPVCPPGGGGGATTAWGAERPSPRGEEGEEEGKGAPQQEETASTPVEEIECAAGGADAASGGDDGIAATSRDCARGHRAAPRGGARGRDGGEWPAANGGGGGAAAVRRQLACGVPDDDDDDGDDFIIGNDDVDGDDDGGIGQMALGGDPGASPAVRDRLVSASLSRRVATTDKEDRGRHFGGWETLGTLHKGPLSKIKLCRRVEAPGIQGPLRDNTEGDDVCAVKIFKKAKLARRMVHRLNALDAAFREVHVTMSLPLHRNVLRGVEVVETDDKLHLIMEHVVHAKPCCPLNDDTENVPVPAASRLTVEAACNYSQQLCEGLALLHKIGLVHSDIKPANVLVDEIENRVVVADFGSSFIVGSIAGSFLTQNDPAGLCSELETATACGPGGEGGDDEKRMSPFHQMSKTAGTPAFLPPEACVEGGVSNGPERDMWAVGMLLYAMLYGKCLYWGNNANQFYEAIREHPAKHVSHVCACVRACVRTIVFSRPTTVLGAPWSYILQVLTYTGVWMFVLCTPRPLFFFFYPGSKHQRTAEAIPAP